MITIYEYFEYIKPKILFHGSPIQGLKELDPNYGITSSDHSDTKRICAATVKYAAAAFTFQWHDGMGVKFGRENGGKYKLEVPKKYAYLLEKPCSIYTVDSKSFKKDNNGLSIEYFSKEKVAVLAEEKFDRVIDALNKYKCEYKII